MPVLKAKVVLVGEAAVGKTSLVRRFVYDTYDDRYVPTIGAKVAKKELSVRAGDQSVDMVLTFWDIMGEATFRDKLADAFFHEAQGVLAVGDLTRPATLHALPDWIGAARAVSGTVPVALLGNKADLLPEAKDDVLEGLAGTLGWPSWRTSAKTGANVEDAMAALASAIAARSIGGERHPAKASAL